MHRYPSVPYHPMAGGSRCRRLTRLLLSVGVVLLAALPSIASTDEGDLPDRVARIASVTGQLYLSPEARAADWARVGVNYPVTSGDNLWLSGDGLADVDYGVGQFRVAGDTSMQVSRLDDRRLSLFVAQGRAILRLRLLDAGDAASIDTPTTQVQFSRTGLYRIDVAANGESTSVVVREGEAGVLVGGAMQQALPGQVLTVLAADPNVAHVRQAGGMDEFDTWSADRDRRYEGNRSVAYVSRQMIGASDLDYYGRWETHAEYGPVWFPNATDAGWAPYRDGYWTEVGAWGLTWVDSAPWGYAPFHYGRWTRLNGRWGWCPGNYVARPAWAPALVGWYGGPSWNPSQRLRSPAYGWVPLGWREAYHPSWSKCDERCWTRHNRPYAVDARERAPAPPPRYANMKYPNAGTLIVGRELVRTKPLAIDSVLPADTAAAAPVLAVAPRPSRAAVGLPARPIGNAPAPASTLVRAKPVPIHPMPVHAAPADNAANPAPAANARASTDARRRVEGQMGVSAGKVTTTPDAAPSAPAAGGVAARPARVAPADRTVTPAARVLGPAAPSPAPAASALTPPARRLAPAAPSMAPPALSLAPPGPSLAPPAPSLAPPAPSMAPAAPSLAPPAPTLAPAAPSLAPVAPSLAPAAPSLAPAVPSLAPAVPSLAPAARPLAPPTSSGAHARPSVMPSAPASVTPAPRRP